MCIQERKINSFILFLQIYQVLSGVAIKEKNSVSSNKENPPIVSFLQRTVFSKAFRIALSYGHGFFEEVIGPKDIFSSFLAL